jgi:hypothetical protein
MTLTKHSRSVIKAMYMGLCLTVAANIVLYVDHVTTNMLAAHVRSSYPTYTQERVDSAVTSYLVYLSVVGALGIVCWLWTIWAVKKTKWWARGLATALFAIGTALALTDLFIKDTSGETGLPALIGWVGILPCMAGLSAVVLLWRRS